MKWKVYDGGDNGWAIAVGDHLFILVHNKSYDFGNHTYLMVQKTFKTKTRIGFGAGVFTRDVVAPNAVRGVGQFTFEQPITDKFGVGSDWYTGKHASGYWTSGGYYKLTKKLTGYAAYSVGNANPSKGNHYFYFELGYKLQLKSRMLSLKRQRSEPKSSSRRLKLRWDVLFKDLSLFISVCMAWLMVRTALRRRRKERAARLKLIKLVPGASAETPSELPVKH